METLCHVARAEPYLFDKPTQGPTCAQRAATVCAHHPEGPRLCSGLDWKCQGVKLAPKLFLRKGPDMILNWSRSQPCPGLSSSSAAQGGQTHTWHPLAAVQVPPDASASFHLPRDPNQKNQALLLQQPPQDVHRVTGAFLAPVLGDTICSTPPEASPLPQGPGQSSSQTPGRREVQETFGLSLLHCFLGFKAALPEQQTQLRDAEELPEVAEHDFITH